MSGPISKKQQRLATLIRGMSGVIRVSDAMHLLDLDRSHAARLLAGWHKQGAIRRVAHGVYVPVQPSALGQAQVLDDPWILVPELYEPAYVGGWTALEHWELTEQLFRGICVLTNRRAKAGEIVHQGVSFYVKTIPASRFFGTQSLWRGGRKLQISDPQKTILDVIDDLYLGAGLQHTMDCLVTYKQFFDEPENWNRLVDHAVRIGNGALFKKLGFLSEYLTLNDGLTAECFKRLTKGYASLGKIAEDRRLVTKWRLWVPENLTR